MRIGIISGGFDPAHKGHIAYINAAREACDFLVVGVNSDEWLKRKKGKAFMPYEDRASIIAGLADVSEVVSFNDDDDSAFDLIRIISELNPHDDIVFMNGGDRTADNIPEQIKCKEAGIECTFEFGTGGEDKKNSSSWILEEWRTPKTERPWGWYRILDKQRGWAVKELTIMPDCSLSNQRHFNRSENWNIVEGEIFIALEDEKGRKNLWVLQAGDSFQIPAKTWHRAYNDSNEPCKIIEVWLGDKLTEEDIERK